MARTKLDRLVQTSTELSEYPNVFVMGSEHGRLSAEDTPNLIMMLFRLEVIRQFEQWLVENETLVHGPLHSSIGQEAVAVGTCGGLEPRDRVTSTHRAHHHFLAKAMAAYTPPNYDPVRQNVPESLQTCVERTLAEILGLSSGWQGGRGGSMHLYDVASGNIGTSAIVGGGIPIAAGAALAAKMRDEPTIALAFFGDGASSIGAFHEGISLARVWRLPAVFLVENNLYSVSTTVEETVGFENIVLRATGQDMPGIVVDGMDPVAVRAAVRLAREYARSGAGPVFIEAKTYRYLHQSGSLPGSAYRYRSKEEESDWRERDPLKVFPEKLLEFEVCSSAEVVLVRKRAEALVAAAVDACTVRGTDGPGIRTSLWPDPGAGTRGVLSDGHEFATVMEREPEQGETDEITFADAISRMNGRAMERDDAVIIMGEEVSHLSGGTYGATRDALKVSPSRVLSTPICEGGFSGAALGAALSGMRPIVELMFPDFALVAADQLFNHIAKARYMYGGQVSVPLMVRTRTAQGRGFGPQHSSDPAGLFALFPGWRIIAPTFPYDYVGLFNAAMRSEDPVLLIEHHSLHATRGPVPKNNLDYIIPFGKASQLREGTSVTVLTWSHPTLRVLAIVDRLSQEGITADVLDLRTLDKTGLDMPGIADSVRKTRRVVIVEDTWASHAISLHIAERIYTELFDVLDGAVVRATGKDVYPPVSKPLESYVLLSDEDIETAIRLAAGYTQRHR